MSRMGIIVNVDECIGCHACFIACKQENQVSPNIQWNRIRKVENREKNIINYLKKDCCFHTKKVWGRQSFFLIFVYRVSPKFSPLHSQSCAAFGRLLLWDKLLNWYEE